MWCTSHSTPPRGPFRRTRPKRGGGKRFWLPYKWGVSESNTAAQEQQKTAGERGSHEQGGAHREDRQGGRGNRGRGPGVLRGLRASCDRGAQGRRGGQD